MATRPNGRIENGNGEASDSVAFGTGVIEVDPSELDGGTGSETNSVGSENNGTAIDPATFAGEQPGEQPVKRRRGRQPGTKYPRKPKPETLAPDKNALVGLLLSVHTMAAAMLKDAELCIEESEAKLLADGIAAVSVAYGLDTVMSPKITASLQLASAMGVVYGPRLMRVMKRKGDKRDALEVVGRTDNNTRPK